MKNIPKGDSHAQAKHRKPKSHRSRKGKMREKMACTPRSCSSPLFSEKPQ